MTGEQFKQYVQGILTALQGDADVMDLALRDHKQGREPLSAAIAELSDADRQTAVTQLSVVRDMAGLMAATVEQHAKLSVSLAEMVAKLKNRDDKRPN